LVLRHAKAIEKVLLDMSLAIEDEDLIVGNSVGDGVITRTSLPAYAKEEEVASAIEQGYSKEGGEYYQRGNIHAF
jgi:hypothetical protein